MSFKTIIDNATGVVTQDGGQVTLPAATEQGQVLLANSAGVWTPYAWNPTFKNRIINGDMRVAQRGTAAVTLAGNHFIVDRMVCVKTLPTGGTVLAQQSSVAPDGFSNSLRYYVTSPATSVPSSAYIGIYQTVEGVNTYDFAWGSADARPITVSFWVRSSVTGTYCMSIGTASVVPRRYVAEYTVSAKDTWERKVITVPGDIAQPLPTNNTTSIAVNFDLGGGSSLITTANSWQNSSTFNRTANQVSFVTAPIVAPDTSNSFYITGVQLEVGSVATPFETRSMQTELALCQRYYSRFAGNANVYVGSGVTYSTSVSVFYVKYPGDMRAIPTVGMSGMRAEAPGLNNYTLTQSTHNLGPSSASLYFTGAFTAGKSAQLYFQTSASYIEFSAEL